MFESSFCLQISNVSLKGQALNGTAPELFRRIQFVHSKSGMRGSLVSSPAVSYESEHPCGNPYQAIVTRCSFY